MTDRSVPGERVPGTPRCPCVLCRIGRAAERGFFDERPAAPPTGVPPEALTVFRDMRWFIEQAIEGWEDDRDIEAMRSRLSTIATALRESRRGDK